MRRYVVVANQTLQGEELLAKLQECARAAPCRFHLAVPATPPQDHWETAEGEAVAIARSNLEAALSRFREVGVEVTGQVCHHNPVEAIREAMLDQEFDEIIVSTGPRGLSRWLEEHVVHRVDAAFDLPVTHVYSRSKVEPPRR